MLATKHNSGLYLSQCLPTYIFEGKCEKQEDLVGYIGAGKGMYTY